MTKHFAFVLGVLLAVFTVQASAQEKNDTIVRFNEKTIQIEDSVGQVKVKVFGEDGSPYNKIYEGIFTDGHSYEKWTVKEELGFDIPLIGKMIHSKKKSKHRSMEAHWAGLGWGFANFADQNLNFNDIDGVSLKSQSSNEFYLNLIEKIVPVYKSIFGLTTGFGMGWHNYYLAGNNHFVYDAQNRTVFVASTESYEYSRLRTFQLTVPLLLEWQPVFENNHKFYVAAGVIGCVNTSTTMRVKYMNTSGSTVEERGLNVAPLSMDYTVQAGYNGFGLFAKYSPFSLFQSGKGPNVRSVSFGAVMNF